MYPIKNLGKIPIPQGRPEPTVFKIFKPTKAQTKTSSIKIENFIDNIVNNEKIVNNKIFMDYFGYFIPSILVRKLYEMNQAKNAEIAK